MEKLKNGREWQKKREKKKERKREKEVWGRLCLSVFCLAPIELCDL